MNRQHLHSTTTIQPHLTNSRLPENTSRQCIRVLFESNNPDKCSEVATGEDFSSLNKSDSRPSNSLFQTARGSGATLSECTFFSQKKAHVTKKTFSRQNYFKDSRQKEAGLSYTQALLDKEPGNMLGDLSTKIMHVQKQLRLIENNSYIMSLSSGARPSFQLLPEARNQRQRTKNTRNSRLQRRQHIKTLHPISFLKKRTRRRLRATG